MVKTRAEIILYVNRSLTAGIITEHLETVIVYVLAHSQHAPIRMALRPMTQNALVELQIAMQILRDYFALWPKTDVMRHPVV